VKARFGDNRNEISRDDEYKGGCGGHCHRAASLAVIEPSGRDQQDGARRDWPLNAVKHRVWRCRPRGAEARIAGQDMQKKLPARGYSSEHRGNHNHAGQSPPREKSGQLCMRAAKYATD
jgi:hypothetical protein